jgi:hypothetical protein
MVDFGKVVPTSFIMTAYFREWIFGSKTGNGMIVHMVELSVEACAQIKEDIKQMKTT